ncbi:hypothetical protein Avbf_17870, partial [Armadillidium vulgare]
MSRRSLGRHIFQKVDEVHAKIKTDLSQQAFLCTTADINESTIERQSATLACSRFKGAHTCTKVAEILNNGANFAKCFKEFGVIIPVVDNVGIDEDTASGETDINDDPNEDDAEFYNSCLEVDEDYLNEQPLPNHLRCASHTLSLTCTTDARTELKGSFSKLYHSVFGKCSALWNLSGRPKFAETINNIFQCQLRLPCPTRRNS